MNENKFTPLEIGLPDYKNERAIIEIYQEICNIADVLLLNLQWFLSDHSDLKLFFDFLQSKQPREFLYSRFIETNKIQVPGLSIEKIIQLDLIDVPKDDFEGILTLRAQLLTVIAKSSNERFYFPLSKLYYKHNSLSESIDDPELRDAFIENSKPEFDKPIDGFELVTLKDGQSILNPEFETALFSHVRHFTLSEQENEVLSVVENAVNALNCLVQSGIIRNDKQRWNIDFDNLINAIVFNLNSETPFSIHPDLPSFKGFRARFETRSRKKTTGRPENMLNFEEMDPVQPEDNPEDILQADDLETEQIENGLL